MTICRMMRVATDVSPLAVVITASNAPIANPYRLKRIDRNRDTTEAPGSSRHNQAMLDHHRCGRTIIAIAPGAPPPGLNELNSRSQAAVKSKHERNPHNPAVGEHFAVVRPINLHRQFLW